MQQYDIQWDLQESSGPSTLTKLFISFLLACFIWSIVAAVKAFWRTRSWPSSRRGKLLELSLDLESADGSNIALSVADIPEAAPEAGLRSLVALKSAPFRDLPMDILGRSDLHFTYLLSALRTTADNLRRLAKLLLIVTAAWIAYGLGNICKGISYTKVMGISAVYGALTEIFVMLCISLFLSAVLYVIRWRIAALLDRRERLWHRLKSQLTLLTPPH
jgi:hypothetical protein